MPADLDLDVHMRFDKDVEPREPVELDTRFDYSNVHLISELHSKQVCSDKRHIVGGCIFSDLSNEWSHPEFSNIRYVCFDHAILRWI